MQFCNKAKHKVNCCFSASDSTQLKRTKNRQLKQLVARDIFCSLSLRKHVSVVLAAEYESMRPHWPLWYALFCLNKCKKYHFALYLKLCWIKACVCTFTGSNRLEHWVVPFLYKWKPISLCTLSQALWTKACVCTFTGSNRLKHWVMPFLYKWKPHLKVKLLKLIKRFFSKRTKLRLVSTLHDSYWK